MCPHLCHQTVFFVENYALNYTEKRSLQARIFACGWLIFLHRKTKFLLKPLRRYATMTPLPLFADIFPAEQHGWMTTRKCKQIIIHLRGVERFQNFIEITLAVKCLIFTKGRLVKPNAWSKRTIDFVSSEYVSGQAA